MIEREAKVDGDRALIARVIYNRLELGMNLEIDATLYYDSPPDTPFVVLRAKDSPTTLICTAVTTDADCKPRSSIDSCCA